MFLRPIPYLVASLALSPSSYVPRSHETSRKWRCRNYFDISKIIYYCIIVVQELWDQNLKHVISVLSLGNFESFLNLVQFKSFLNLVKFNSVINLVQFKSFLNLVKFKSVLTLAIFKYVLN